MWYITSSLSKISHNLIFPKYKSKLGNHGNYIAFKLKFVISSSVSLHDFVSLGHGVFSSSFNRIDKNRYCLITNPNFFFEFLHFFVFSHFLVNFHRISLIFLLHISQKTQKSVVSSHLDSNTADSTRLITGYTLSYEMFIVDCWLLILKLENSLYLLIVDL